MKRAWLSLFSSLWLTSALTYCPERCQCKWESNVSLVINCSNAQFNSLPIGIDPQVTCLDLSLNEIKKIDVARDFPVLVHLNLSHNKLSDVRFQRDVPTLQTLDLSYNSFSDLRNLSLSSLSRLQNLDISHSTKLNHIPRLISESVENLDLSHSYINYYEQDALANLTNLRTLDLSHNSLWKIQGLRSSNLQELDLSGGELKFLTRGQLEGFTGLLKLNVSRNIKLDTYSMGWSVDYTCLSIMNVDFSYLEVQTFNLSGFCYLEVANLSHNHLKSLEEEFFLNNTELVHVDLSRNDIEAIHPKTFAGSKKIRVLDLAHNRVENLTFSKYLTHVEWLNLSGNKVKGLELLYLKNARDVIVSRNVIYKVTEDLDETMPKLRRLDLSRNNLEILTQMKSRSLRLLDLNDCRIISIELGAFQELPALEKLNLAGNKLTRLDYRTLTYPKGLVSVKLGHNPWDCDCSSSDFVKLYTFLITNNSLESLDELHCAGNPEAYSMTWKEVCEEKWREEEMWLTSKKTFYSLLSTFVLVLLIIGVIVGCRFYRGQKTGANNTSEQGSARAEEEALESLQPPFRASTPPPNYEDALLLPKLTEEQRQLAMSRTELDDVS